MTLLIPYVEVDLGQPDGLTTLFSVSNAASTKVLAHGILWSDWGIPVYSWDFYLAPGDVASYNLRDLVTYGAFPSTNPPVGVGQHCARPLTASLGPEALAALQRRLTGRPDPAGGLCSSEPREDTSIATGSITIDYVRDCAHDGIDDPFDFGYLTGEGAVAGNVAALIGDFFLVDPAADLAEGYSAYPLHRAASNGDSFWEGVERSDLRREPLSTHWRLRFLLGGPFAARTSFFVFHRRVVPPAPAACETILLGTSPHGTWSFDAYSQSGERVVHNLQIPGQGRRTAARLELDLPDDLLSGTVNFRAVYLRGLGRADRGRRPEHALRRHRGARPFRRRHLRNSAQLKDEPAMPSTQLLPFVLAACLLPAAAPLAAAPLPKTPGATLIIPYFEVDLDAPDGRTTLVSVGNAGEPVVAHATVWSDRGIPVYAWNIYLGKDALATYNLRDILACRQRGADPGAGRLRRLQRSGGDPGAGRLRLDGAAEAAHRPESRQRRVRERAADGPQPRHRLAHHRYGHRVPERQRPALPERFRLFQRRAGRWRALSQVLWGDVTLVDPAENFAQGFEATALGIAAGQPYFADWAADPAVAREALDNEWGCSQMRFLAGRAFRRPDLLLRLHHAGAISRNRPLQRIAGRTGALGFPDLRRAGAAGGGQNADRVLPQVGKGRSGRRPGHHRARRLHQGPNLLLGRLGRGAGARRVLPKPGVRRDPGLRPFRRRHLRHLLEPHLVLLTIRVPI